MISVGDFVFDTIEKANVQVLEKIEAWGYISYKVFNPATGRVYKANEEQLSSSGNTMQYDENYLRYVTLLSKIKNETAGGFLSSLASGIIPLPHQLHVLNRAMETNNIRYILADEVGLGKTIEAGMIIRELKSRGLVSRILVVCPTGLVTQWASEMQEKFHEKFQVILPSDYDTIRRLTDNDDVYGQFDQVISPMDSIKPIEKHAGWSEEKVEKYNEERIYSIINSGWDLIIIDEAHRVAGSSGEVARYKLGNLLAQASPYLLLLSATPHNGKTEPFLRLIRLLDADAFPNAKSIVREQVAPFLIRTEKREAIDNNGNLLFKNGHASQVEKNLYPVEAEMKQQLTNAQKYKDVIREEKDLTKLVGTESNFDVDSALRTMLTYYECWQGHDPRLIDRISIADEEITQHLKTELVQDRTAPLMSIQIDNFPNEEGYFMLWELSISEKESGKRILPIFVNSAMLLRPMAGKRIMDVFLDGNSKLRVSSAPNVDAEIYSKLEKSCMDFAYDTFVELKEKQMQQNEESFKKYMYALELRQEAAEHIGIENIRRSRLQKLQKEKANIEAQHRKGSQVYPDFRLIMMARLEA